jgi:hypothetical protein
MADEIHGQKMSDYTKLNELTQAEQETYLANAAVTTYGKTSDDGNNTNVNVPLSAIKPDVPVTDVTVGGNSVVSNGVAIIPKYSADYPIVNNGYAFSLDYNNTQFKIAGTNYTELTLTNPVPAPGTNQNRGKVLTVNDSDAIVWAQPSASVEISQYNGDVSTVSAVNAASSGGYIFNLNIDSETLEEQHDDVAGKKYVTVKNPLPSTDGASNGNVLTITNGAAGWAAPQGGSTIPAPPSDHSSTSYVLGIGTDGNFKWVELMQDGAYNVNYRPQD